MKTAPTTPSYGSRALAALCAIIVFALTWVAWTATGQDATDPVAALHEGNRLYRSGQIEAAVEVYQQGYSPSAPHPTLVYNLGTALHHLDRLPEAVLWYRRGGDSQDPWLQENLWLARRSLGSQTLPPAGFFGTLSGHSGLLKMMAIACGWLSLAILVFTPSLPRWVVLCAALATATLYAGSWALDAFGPAPAVLLRSCTTATGDLPAGTEVWVRRAGDAWQLSGSNGSFCPLDHAELVRLRD